MRKKSAMSVGKCMRTCLCLQLEGGNLLTRYKPVTGMISNRFCQGKTVICLNMNVHCMGGCRIRILDSPFHIALHVISSDTCMRACSNCIWQHEMITPQPSR